MSTIVVLEVKAKPGTGDSLVALFKEILPDTRSYDGCISLDFIQNQDDPDTLIAYEAWETREHYEKYFQWRVETGAIATLEPLIEGPPVIRYFNMTDA
ncbi:uncharacterized protein METZ01_LOCUS480780 [marine metagenome]|uniref:ABM domain-containing protein n=1 Tax=marine metagenome TaxID=408172 RepID=A0A383C696_9ZZZZ